MANKPVKNREGKTLMRHAKSKNTAWMSDRTLAHHRAAGWVLASSKDDQPAPAGDSGAPSGVSTDDPKGTNA